MPRGPQALSIGSKILLGIAIGILLALAMWWLPIANSVIRVAVGIATAIANAIVFLIDRRRYAQLSHQAQL
jgi:flagellar biosynthesis protein FliR